MRQPFIDGEGIKVAVIGGGTGSFTLLTSLKAHPVRLTAIVNMADDGGSTGVLRDELGALPPGDVRQCLVALSDSSRLRELFNYRFEEGTFRGHAFGNVMLSALEKMTGSFNEAVDTAADILHIHGTVIPATLDDVRLKMEWPEASVILSGERVIDEQYFSHDPRRATLSLEPSASANSQAIAAIAEADLIVIAPGDLYTSLGPLLVIEGIGEALNRAAAPIVYVSNLVTKHGQTQGMTVADHAAEIERFIGYPVLDYVLYNQQQPDAELAQRYREEEGSYMTTVDSEAMESAHYTPVSGHFLGELAIAASHNDHLPVAKRSLIRHDTAAVADAIMSLYRNQNE